jgi:cytochrome c oxidase cbb3-type subunit 1
MSPDRTALPAPVAHAELPAPAVHAEEERLVDTRFVGAWLAGGLVWLILAPVFGLLAAMKLDDPLFLEGIEGLQFGRLRIMHVNGVIWGVFSSTMLGFLGYAVPKLTGRPLTRPLLLWASFWIFHFGILFGEVGLFLGYLQGLEAAEFGLVTDVCIAITVFVWAAVALETMIKRRVDRLYVSLWYWGAALVWTSLTVVLGNFVLPYTVTGANSAAMHGFYLHAVVGLWITPIGVGAAYYLLPASVRGRLYSHKLSLIGFWALAFFYPLNGIHHYLYSPIAEWAQTIAIGASMMLILPVVVFTANMAGTMIGKWGTFVGSNFALKFTVVGAAWYLVTCIQGPFQALRWMQRLTHFGEFNVGHAHSAIFGAFVLWSMAAVYFLIPRYFGGRIWSLRLAAWHYWLEILGFLLMFLSLSIGGFVQGQQLLTSTEMWVDTLPTGYWLLRTIGGTLMDVGLALFVFNMAMTVAAFGRDRGVPA